MQWFPIPFETRSQSSRWSQSSRSKLIQKRAKRMYIFKMVFSSGAKKEVEQLPEAVQARIKSTVRYAKIW